MYWLACIYSFRYMRKLICRTKLLCDQPIFCRTGVHVLRLSKFFRAEDHFSGLALIELQGSEISNILLTSLLNNFTRFSSPSKFFSNALIVSPGSLGKLLVE